MVENGQTQELNESNEARLAQEIEREKVVTKQIGRRAAKSLKAFAKAKIGELKPLTEEEKAANRVKEVERILKGEDIPQWFRDEIMETARRGGIGTLPVGVDLHLVREKDMCTFTYTEYFPSKKMGKLTLRVIKPIFTMMGVNVRLLPKTAEQTYGIQVYGKASKDSVGGMMMSEFMMWTRVAEMKLRDLFLGGTLGAFGAAKDAGIPGFGKKARKDGKRRTRN